MELPLHYPGHQPPGLSFLQREANSGVEQSYRFRPVGGVWSQEFLRASTPNLPIRNTSTESIYLEIEYIDRWYEGGEVIREERQLRTTVLLGRAPDTGTIDFTITPNSMYMDPYGENYYQDSEGNWIYESLGPTQIFTVTVSGFTYSGTPLTSGSVMSALIEIQSGDSVNFIELEQSGALLSEASVSAVVRAILTEGSVGPGTYGTPVYGYEGPTMVANPQGSLTTGYFRLPPRIIGTDPEDSVPYPMTITVTLYISPGLGYPDTVVKTVTFPTYWAAQSSYY